MENYPIILVRGFDPMGVARPDPFYGFNAGTVYFNTVDASRIFEGFVVSFLKDPVHGYTDTSNVIRFHAPRNVNGADNRCFTESPTDALGSLGFPSDPEEKKKTFWVFRYYDAFPGGLISRAGLDLVPYFARELQRYIAVVKTLTGAPKVNILCHSMGGIITRHLIQRRYFAKPVAEENIHRVVSLGTPHGGISYMRVGIISLASEILGFFEPEAMDPGEIQKPAMQVTVNGMDDLPPANAALYKKNKYGLDGKRIDKSWDPENWLCVVGTRYVDYKARMGTFFIGKHSDGLVKQEDAVLTYPDVATGKPSTKYPPRAYINKTHTGYDSLVTSRESFEIATRFLFGTHWVKLYIQKGSALTQFNLNNQYYIGASIKPRGVDFFLTQVDRISENCATLHKRGEDSGQFDTSEKYLLKFKEDLLLYQGALDMARSSDKTTMVFRIDIRVYAEDDPLAGNELSDPAFDMGHNDSKHIDEQIIVRVTLKDMGLQWFQNSADVVGLNPDSVKPITPERIETDSKNAWVYRNLPLEVKNNFKGKLRIEVTAR
jgi:hypothetical protein